MSTTKDIVSSFAEISKLMDLAEKRKLSEEGKYMLAIQTAYLSLLIRKRYGLTSSYYTVAEMRAIEKYKEIYET